jgi:hypothetical protein
VLNRIRIEPLRKLLEAQLLSELPAAAVKGRETS